MRTHREVITHEDGTVERIYARGDIWHPIYRMAMIQMLDGRKPRNHRAENVLWYMLWKMKRNWQYEV